MSRPESASPDGPVEDAPRRGLSDLSLDDTSHPNDGSPPLVASAGRQMPLDAAYPDEARRLLAAVFAAKAGFESDVLLERKPSLHALTVLKQVGKLLSQIEPDQGAMTSARVLYALPIAWALVYHRARITSHPGPVLAKALRDAERVSAFTPNAALFGVAAVVAGES